MGDLGPGNYLIASCSGHKVPMLQFASNNRAAVPYEVADVGLRMLLTTDGVERSAVGRRPSNGVFYVTYAGEDFLPELFRILATTQAIGVQLCNYANDVTTDWPVRSYEGFRDGMAELNAHCFGAAADRRRPSPQGSQRRSNRRRSAGGRHAVEIPDHGAAGRPAAPPDPQQGARRHRHGVPCLRADRSAGAGLHHVAAGRAALACGGNRRADRRQYRRLALLHGRDRRLLGRDDHHAGRPVESRRRGPCRPRERQGLDAGGDHRPLRQQRLRAQHRLDRRGGSRREADQRMPRYRHRGRRPQ